MLLLLLLLLLTQRDSPNVLAGDPGPHLGPKSIPKPQCGRRKPGPQTAARSPHGAAEGPAFSRRRR